MPSSSSISVAVVILNWNGRKLLEEFLPSVVEHSAAADVIVIDNGSSDESIDYLNSNFPSVEIVRLEKNYGFAGGYNQGLKGLKQDVFVLLNSDVEVTAKWIEPIVERFEKRPALGICQPKILSYREKDKFEYAGAAGGWLDKWGYPFCRGRIFDELETDHGQYDQDQNTFWASGAAFFIRRETFESLGGFDEDFFAHMEEIDLCWRAQQAGHEVACIPSSIVYHLGGASLDASSPQKTYLNFRNGLAMLWKNSNRRLVLIPTRLVLDGVAGLRLLLSGKPKHCWAVVRAHFAFYFSIGKWSSKRKSIERKSSALNGYLNKSVVSQHFLKGKKKFDEIV